MPKVDREWMERNTTLASPHDDVEDARDPRGGESTSTTGLENTGAEVIVPKRRFRKGLMVLALVILGAMVLGRATRVIPIHDAARHAAPGSLFDNRATVYVFRGDSRAGRDYSLVISQDGRPSGSVGPRHYLVFPVTGGQHRITAGCSSACSIPTIRFDADYAPGKTYYFVVDSAFLYGYQTWIVGSNVHQLDPGPAHTLLGTYLPGRSK